MGFEKLQFNLLNENEMVEKAHSLYLDALKRRSVREFSNRNVPLSVLKTLIKTATSAPSGANKQPWHFVIIKSKKIKKEIRIAAEKEERAFYNYRATKEWKKDLDPFNLTWEKPFLEDAPSLIVVFKKIYNLEGKKKSKNYYVSESVGIACGFLILAIHNAGFVCLPHTPSPMGFLENILERPKNERAFLLIPVGYPAKSTLVPNIKKKLFEEICTIK